MNLSPATPINRQKQPPCFQMRLNQNVTFSEIMLACLARRLMLPLSYLPPSLNGYSWLSREGAESWKKPESHFIVWVVLNIDPWRSTHTLPLQFATDLLTLTERETLSSGVIRKSYTGKLNFHLQNMLLFHQIQWQLGQEISHLWPRATRLPHFTFSVPSEI